ncbi:MAG: endonuclease/exonuclease/phosphatase family protein [Phycisphaeraceae bacterium]|nr:MAG: endonuclease/exonuclease/phosphatase family protein [Phycisphaeraceae bacterium]
MGTVDAGAGRAGASVRIVAWNILHGGGPRRTAEVALALAGYEPDVVVLTEFRAGRGGQLRAVLADLGLEHQRSSVGEGGVTAGVNGVLIASRWGLRGVEPGPPEEEGIGAKWVSAGVSCGGRWGEVMLGGVHIPPEAGTGRAAMWAHVVSAAGAWAGGAAVIAGDFNTGRHRVDERGSRFGSVAMMGRLATLGYVDAWRAMNPGSRARSWRGVGSVGGAGATRVDGVWVSGAMSGCISRGFLGVEAMEAGVSDHAPVVVEVG